MGFDKTKKVIDKLTGSKKERATALLNKIEFMDVQLQQLQKDIAENGWTETYKNGENQFGIKKSANAEVYNTLMKNYTSALKQIDEMLPAEAAGGSKLDALLND